MSSRKLSELAKSLLMWAPLRTVSGAVIPEEVPVGVYLQPGTYWGDIIPKTHRWEWMDRLNQIAVGMDLDDADAVREFWQRYKAAFEHWASSQADVALLNWEIVEPTFLSAIGTDRIRVVVAFRVGKNTSAVWGPDQIETLGFVPTKWRGKRNVIPTDQNTAQTPDVESTTEMLQRLAEDMATGLAKGAGALLGVGLAVVLGWTLLKGRISRS